MRIISRGILFAVVVTSTILSGCATIVTGGKQGVVFDSSPQGANIEIHGLVLGKTPATITLSRGSDSSVQIRKAGYKAVSIVPSKTSEPLLFGNIIFGGLLGSTTDYASGSIHKFAPNSYFVTLEPLDSTRTVSGVYANAEDVGRVKQFILISYDPLSKNIAEGGGKHLQTLFSLLNIDAALQPSALEKLRALLTLNENIVDYADGVIRYFITKKEVSTEVPPTNNTTEPIMNMRLKKSNKRNSLDW